MNRISGAAMRSIKISIVMTYFERPEQLRNTLDSFDFQGYGEGVEVIIVDDGSVKAPAAGLIGMHDFGIKVMYLEPAQKWYCNPCVPFNIGFNAAMGDVVIIQNAECYHHGDIAGHALQNLNDGNYLSYACLSQTKEDSEMASGLQPFARLREMAAICNTAAVGDGVPGWYNHSTFFPRALHFCAAISLRNLRRLKGFDERFAKGLCFDDDEFLYRIKRSGLKVDIVDDPFVVHQWHYNRPNTDPVSGEKYLRNKLIFEIRTRKEGPYWLFLATYAAQIAIGRGRSAVRKIPGAVSLGRKMKRAFGRTPRIDG
jgi:glycosyltransferase involved in cell wall biosynthesis